MEVFIEIIKNVFLLVYRSFADVLERECRFFLLHLSNRCFCFEHEKNLLNFLYSRLDFVFKKMGVFEGIKGKKNYF